MAAKVPEVQVAVGQVRVVGEGVVVVVVATQLRTDY